MSQSSECVIMPRKTAIIAYFGVEGGYPGGCLAILDEI